MLASLGYRYGTDESNKFAGEVQILKLTAYMSSVEMAKERGSFPIYNSSLEENEPIHFKN